MGGFKGLLSPSQELFGYASVSWLCYYGQRLAQGNADLEVMRSSDKVEEMGEPATVARYCIYNALQFDLQDSKDVRRLESLLHRYKVDILAHVFVKALDELWGAIAYRIKTGVVV